MRWCYVYRLASINHSLVSSRIGTVLWRMWCSSWWYRSRSRLTHPWRILPYTMATPWHAILTSLPWRNVFIFPLKKKDARQKKDDLLENVRFYKTFEILVKKSPYLEVTECPSRSHMLRWTAVYFSSSDRSSFSKATRALYWELDSISSAIWAARASLFKNSSELSLSKGTLKNIIMLHINNGNYTKPSRKNNCQTESLWMAIDI